MLRVWADAAVVMMQVYIMASFVCEVYKVKEPYGKSLFFAYIQQIVAYIFVNYLFSVTAAQRIIAGIVIFTLVGFTFFEGSRIRQIICGVTEYAIFLALDLLLAVMCLPFVNAISHLSALDQKFIGRSLGTACMFMVYMAFKLVADWKGNKKMRGITMLSVLYGVIQLVILNVLALSNPEGMLERRIPMTVLFAVVMMGGYLIVTELFRQNLRQQEKQAELEHMALEEQYQYNYYKKAYEQGEYLRDIRHDMRNQLQAMQHLFQTGAEGRLRAEEMSKELSRKMERDGQNIYFSDN